MLMHFLKAGAVLTLVVAATSAAAAPSQVQNPAGSATQATDRVVPITNNQSSIVMLPSPAPGTWPILLSGVGMMGFAARRRAFAA
jgi:hypothetical protein